jgi:hypothetical protein
MNKFKRKRMTNMKKVISFILIITVVLSLVVIQTSAATHNCIFKRISDEEEHYTRNNTTHTLHVVALYKCFICGTEAYLEDVYPAEEHEYANWACTGYDYHSGVRHFYELEGECVCGETQVKIQAVACSGDGVTCTNPFLSIEPELEIS